MRESNYLVMCYMRINISKNLQIIDRRTFYIFPAVFIFCKLNNVLLFSSLLNIVTAPADDSVDGWWVRSWWIQKSKYVFLKILQKSKFTKTPVPESLYNKVASLQPATLLKKKTLTYIFFCDFCIIFGTTSFMQSSQATASSALNFVLYF